jgi:lactoylglutathione lyase
VRLNYAIVFVSDMARSVAFYRDVVGLPLRFESPGWTEFDTGSATLALHSGDGRESSTTEDGHPAGRCHPGLAAPDLDAFHKRMMEKGVRCLQPPRSVFGSRVAQYADPDGLAISVGEQRPAGLHDHEGGSR